MVLLLVSLLFGLLLGLFYDLYKMALAYCGCKRAATAVCDLLWWLALLLAACLLLAFSQQQIRLAVLLWGGWGLMLYRFWLRSHLPFSAGLLRRLRWAGQQKRRRRRLVYQRLSAVANSRQEAFQSRLNRWADRFWQSRRRLKTKPRGGLRSWLNKRTKKT